MRCLAEIVHYTHPTILPQTASARQAYEVLQKAPRKPVLVTDSNECITGIVTSSEVQRMLKHGWATDTTTLADVMRPKPVCVQPESTAIEALRVMWDCGLDEIPVVARGHILGVVTRDDFQPDEQDCLNRERELWEHMR